MIFNNLFSALLKFFKTRIPCYTTLFSKMLTYRCKRFVRVMYMKVIICAALYALKFRLNEQRPFPKPVK